MPRSLCRAPQQTEPYLVASSLENPSALTRRLPSLSRSSGAGQGHNDEGGTAWDYNQYS